jgi:predicted RNase H-like nuclease (RuvC/YqgF family)
LNEHDSNAIFPEDCVQPMLCRVESTTREGISMNARVVAERAMADDTRIFKLEANVQHLQSDVTEIKGDIKSLRDVVDLLKTQLLSFKTEVATEFGSVKTSIESLRTAIERAKLWMVVTGAGTILSVWGAALALARFLKP